MSPFDDTSLYYEELLEQVGVDAASLLSGLLIFFLEFYSTGTDRYIRVPYKVVERVPTGEPEFFIRTPAITPS